MISTTSLGMEGGKYPYFCPSIREAKPNLVVADIVYTSLETPRILKFSARRGILQTAKQTLLPNMIDLLRVLIR
ncbi:MAG: hypothetical protein J6P19_09860 [Acetobacter sp.]|nr:hypothetical protein [Acetobacter sp.]